MPKKTAKRSQAATKQKAAKKATAPRRDVRKVSARPSSRSGSSASSKGAAPSGGKAKLSGKASGNVGGSASKTGRTATKSATRGTDKAASRALKAKLVPRRSHDDAQPSRTGGEENQRRHREAQAAAEAALAAALDKKALAPVLLDVAELASYTDFIAIVSGRSDRQVDAIAEHVSAVMKQRGARLIGREGAGNGRWLLLDFGDVIVHVFYHPVREVYDIEGLWIDAPRVALKDVPPEAMHVQPDALYAMS